MTNTACEANSQKLRFAQDGLDTMPQEWSHLKVNVHFEALEGGRLLDQPKN